MVHDAIGLIRHTPGGAIGFTVDLSEDGRSREIGEIRRGDRWIRLLEMELRRNQPLSVRHADQTFPVEPLLRVRRVDLGVDFVERPHHP